MTIEKIYLVAGGDRRFVHLAEMLTKKGRVYLLGCGEHASLLPEVRCLSTISQLKRQPDYLVLPLPVTVDGTTLHTPLCAGEAIQLTHLFDLCHRDTLILGGSLPPSMGSDLQERGLRFICYSDREDFLVGNAVPTAEGALQILLEELPTVLMGKQVLITGFGRIARVLTEELLGLGAHVTVGARRETDRLWAAIAGADVLPLSELEQHLPQFQVILNTVPAPLFQLEQLVQISPDCLLVDLASRPGGIDFEQAEALGRKAIHALSLPGKCAPLTAAAVLENTLRHCVEEAEGRADSE